MFVAFQLCEISWRLVRQRDNLLKLDTYTVFMGFKESWVIQDRRIWILKFHEINTIEQAQKLVGSALLVKDEDRPVLEEGEFYTRDLVGMRVFLKETRRLVGTVINVFNSGASDLLHVELLPDQNAKPRLEGVASGPLVWVPFVEAIVPNIDLSKREMLITPPKGLLELNIRADERSKKKRGDNLNGKRGKSFRNAL
ncbi:hypothetical protein HAX54_035004 [Datura stramonium]|uniref:Ribosome maturation factor RimM PRC barrel domain-containing protein n=1 Tax=Datura stramonium TaxID=4076 RepID=A0ABS8SER6_DATST|nr:hypothetical protein [Datura stramonium]